MLTNVSNPKQFTPANKRWYRYYAGYSRAFVSDAVAGLELGANDRVIDPWVGSGTTLRVAAESSIGGVGVDLNPAIVPVARGQMVANDSLASLAPLASDILRFWRDADVDKDELTRWFDRSTASRLRGLANRINRVLIDGAVSASERVDIMSSLASFFYVALFETSTQIAKAARSANPTWTRTGRIGKGNIVASRDEIKSIFLATVARLIDVLKATSLDVTSRDGVDVVRGSSSSIPLGDGSFTACITSPPYCTRLDYVAGHTIELALLDFSETEVHELRRAMIGTTTVTPIAVKSRFGDEADSFLSAVGSHESHGSKSYYEPNFRQYFDGMSKSLAEIDRVLLPDSAVVMVVQDSRYKELHLDLALALAEMAASHRWTLTNRIDFPSSRSMVAVNSRARAEVLANRPTESVIEFRTSARSS